LFWLFFALVLNYFASAALTIGPLQLGLYKVELMFWIMSCSLTLLQIRQVFSIPTYDNEPYERIEVEDFDEKEENTD